MEFGKEEKDSVSKVIPAGWKKVRLENVSEHINDKSNSNPSPYIEIGDIAPGSWTYQIKDKSAPGSTIKAKKGDICISTVRPTRRAMMMLKEDSAVSPAFTVLRYNGHAAWPFVFEMIKKQQFYNRLGVLATGSTYPTCSHSDVLSYEFPLPPLPEQRKIAAILSSVDNAIEKTKAVIEQTKVVKKGLMQKLLTSGIPGRHKKFKKTSIGEMPEEWEVVKFEEAIAYGPQNGLYRHESVYGRGTYIVRIDNFYVGKFITTDFKRVNISEAEVKLYKLQTNDILINRVNSLSHLGKAAIVPFIKEDTVFESNMMRVRLHLKIMLPEYAILVLCTPSIKRQIENSAKKAVAQCSINQTDVKNLLMACPSIDEQQIIIDLIFKKENFLEKNIVYLEQLDNLKSSLMQVLLTGEVRVKA